MAGWEPESGYEQFHVSVGLSLLLQYALGLVSHVGSLRGEEEYSRCFRCSE